MRLTLEDFRVRIKFLQESTLDLEPEIYAICLCQPAARAYAAEK